MAPYTYLPLDAERNEIRLLVIQHDTWEAPLKCSIRVVSLNDEPVYQTLSYVWGKPSPQREVYIDDCTISVNPNLFDAITRLRSYVPEQQQLEIWIDAICVDQESVPERGYSVALMHQIYSQCTEVIVWLGEVSPGVSKLELAHSIDDEQDQKLRASHAGGCECLETAWTTLPGLALTALLPSQIRPAVGVLRRLSTIKDCNDLQLCRVFADLDEMVAFRSFMNYLNDNPWFSRVWTLQEVILAPNVQMSTGQYVFPFDILFNAIQACSIHQRSGCCMMLAYYHELGWKAFERVSEIGAVRTEYQIGGAFNNLFGLRALFPGRKASLDVDLVYGVLGLCPSELVPRYDWTVEDVYIDITRRYLQTLSSCDCYGIATFVYSAMKHRYPHLPSWVMDWTALELSPTFDSKDQWFRTHLRSNHSNLLNADHLSGFEFHENNLLLRGYILDTITTVGDENSSHASGPYSDQYMESVHKWRELVLAQHKPDDIYTLPKGYSTSSHTWATVWIKCLCSSNRTGIPSGDNLGLFKLTDEEIDIILEDSKHDLSNVFVLDWKPQYLVDPSIKDSTQCLTKMVRSDLYIQALITAGTMLHEQRMLLSEQGYMGIGNRDILVGDCIFLSGRCARPLILRRVQDSVARTGRQTYKIVSACHLEGFMKGPSEPLDIACEEFWIE